MVQKAPRPVPEGMQTATTHLWFSGDCGEAIRFYEKVLGAQLVAPPVKGPGGKGVMHAMIRIGDTNLMLADAWPNHWEHGPREGATARLWLYVEDCDSLYQRAIDAGCSVLEPMMDAFWGDRAGSVRDPFGHCWAIATNKWILTPEEMRAREAAWLQTLKA